MKKLILLSLILASFFASGQTHYLMKSGRFVQLQPVDTAYLPGKVWMKYSTGELKIHWGDSTSVIWPAPSNTTYIVDSTGVAGSFTPVRIPFSVGPTTLSDSYALTWDTTNLYVGLKNAKLFSHTGSSYSSFYFGNARDGYNGPGNIGNESGLGWNIGIGVNPLSSVTSGYGNISIGLDPLRDLTTGYENVAIGSLVNRTANSVRSVNIGYSTNGESSIGDSYSTNINNTLYGYFQLSPGAGEGTYGMFKAENTTSTVAHPLRLRKMTAGTLGAGTGVGLNFETETETGASYGNVEIGSTIESVTTDITATSEDFDLVFKTMAAGATAAERVRFTSTGAIAVNGASNYGSSGQVLTSNGNTAPTWEAPSGGSLTVGTTAIASGTTTRVLYDNAGTLGEYTISGSGNVAMTTSPVFTTPNIGTATGTASGNWPLTGTGTLTGATTITSNTANQHIFNGTWTATANNQYHTNFGGTFTLRGTASDELDAYSFTPSIVSAGNSQSSAAILINPTFSGTSTSRRSALKIASGAVVIRGDGAEISNVSIGSATDLVSGTIRLSVTGISSGTVFQANDNSGNQVFSVWNNSTEARLGTTTSVAMQAAANGNGSNTGTGFLFSSLINNSNRFGFTFNGGTIASTTGAISRVVAIENATFSPTSGSVDHAALRISNTLNQTGSASGNIYGIVYEPTVTSVLGTHYAFVSSAGRHGFGTLTPTAKVHLAAGTATASTAPLKFTSGTLLTAAEAGAVEFLTDKLHYTTTTGAIRRTIVAGSNGRATGQTAANTSVATYTLGASDATYEVSANVLVTTSSGENFTVTVDYTDEGNTARTATMNFALVAGTVGTPIAFANGAVPYTGIPLHIRCKASTAITVKTTGTFTGCTYNVEGQINQTN